MFDRFDCWKYTDNHNCWDFVREFLIDRAGVPSEDVPKYGICPTDKKAMTKAAREVQKTFTLCEPQQYAIACHFVGRVIIHVGVVDGDIIRHTGKVQGTTKSTVRDFEAMAQKTIYKIHRSLCQH